MPRAKYTISEAERSRRFIETARDLGCDETGKAFEKTFKKVVRRSRPKSQKEPKRGS
jgi:hypothetical protein